MWSVWLVFCDCGFHSVCPLVEKDKRLMEASWWERLTEGETGSCSDGQGCVPSLLFELRPNYGGGNEDSGEKMVTVRSFFILGSKITEDSDCSHENKRCLFLGRKAMINLDSILKSRDITLPAKTCLVKTRVFPVVMYGCETWTIKKAER